MSEQKQFRCAVYTRKSSEEGLDQDFNSLEAQREAGEAYVRSQAHEGWNLITDRFDDGGFSGGNMQRPALARLMALIREGKVDVIVIYKIDRLTRSLTDFARLAETFDKHGVSFVSVTQQFNTTTSMGRLMLNVLLSFAQFEREITGERIRDKIAASKKKGMWMGGNVPMGYDVKDRQLLINETDAETIRTVFRLYLEEGNVPALLNRLTQAEIGTAVRTTAKGRTTGDRPFTRGHLYKLLSNPIYIGRIPHKKTSHPGQHPAIIERDTWEEVQAQLGTNTQGPRSRRRRAAAHPSLLAGILYSAAGNRFIPMHANKGSRRYRYYVEGNDPRPRIESSTNDDADTSLRCADLGSGATPTRLPAHEIEIAVLEALRNGLEDRRELPARLGDIAPDQIPVVFASSARLADTFAKRIGATQIEVFRGVVKRVVYSRDAVALELSCKGLRKSLGLPAQRPWQDGREANFDAADQGNFTVKMPLIYRRRGVQMKLMIPGSKRSAPPDQPLVAAIVRAHDWADRLISGQCRTIAEIAEQEGLSFQYVSQVMPLAFLAPNIVERILVGDHPPGLTADGLIWREALPNQWRGQEKSLRVTAGDRRFGAL
jgi:site-specific DNA recombinase